MIYLNGKEKECPPNHTILHLVDREGYSIPRIAVELNGAIVPKARYGDVRLADGDRVEVVSFVGGG